MENIEAQEQAPIVEEETVKTTKKSTKKSTTKKTSNASAKKSAEKKATEQKVDAPVDPDTSYATVVKEKRVFAPTDVVPCRSITYGKMFMQGLKNRDILYIWENYGDVQEVEYQDLRALKSRHSGYLYAPRFIIEDEDLMDEWKDIGKVYDTVAKVGINELFYLPVPELARRLQAMPKTFKDTIKNVASNKILNGELDSISKIKAIDEVLGTNLIFYIQ